MLELDDVCKIYPPAVAALDRVRLRVDAGELVAVVGRSGSGKSTLLNVMGTLDLPTSGAVRVRGTETAALSDAALTVLRATTLGFVFQGFHLDDGASAVENVMTGLMYAGAPRRERRDLALRALDRVGLSARAGHRPQQLSGGERQRVAIARAIAKRPSLVLADEPTGALDRRNGELVVDLLERLNADGTTIVVITHDPEVARRLPRTVELADGRIVHDTGRRAPGGVPDDRGEASAR